MLDIIILFMRRTLIKSFVFKIYIELEIMGTMFYSTTAPSGYHRFTT